MGAQELDSDGRNVTHNNLLLIFHLRNGRSTNLSVHFAALHLMLVMLEAHFGGQQIRQIVVEKRVEAKRRIQKN